jgi:hypothetical protein
MMKINNSIFALCMCTGLALAAGTPIVGVPRHSRREVYRAQARSL